MGENVNHYQHADCAALVLAAGQGTRMKSDLPKVLHPMAGQPLLAHVLESLDELHVGRVLVVVGHGRERVLEHFAGAEVEWVVQAEQRGTGHAVMMAEPALADYQGTLLVVCGDTPLLRASTLHALLEKHQQIGAAGTVLSMRVPDPTGYGRIVRTGTDGVEAIVEHRDATPEQRTIDEVNSGVFAFQYPALRDTLSALTAHNDQGEYYLTDTMALLRRSGHAVAVECAPDYRELMGINTVDQLEQAERAWHELRDRSTTVE
jgi:bifunctional UDP-N-acetylglucosamine pyrophosphorylase/glucosamine-1-phosphate N-acetyltransferase